MSIPLPTAVRWLRRASLLYLGLPVAIFFWGWLRVPLAAGCVALMIWSIWRAGWGQHGEADGTEATQIVRVPAWAVVIGGILPSIVLVAMSGAGGWGSGDSDWFKHDTVLFDLITRDWPVTYSTSRGPILLVYYTAFYLPAAALGKWTGSYFVASQSLAVTMLVGVWLSLAWLFVLGLRGENFRPAGWWRACLLFFGFAGMDVLGKAAVNLGLSLPAGAGDWSDIEWWAQAFQYSSNAAALFWAPQHAIGAWLPTALVLAEVLHPARGRSPTASVGLPVSIAMFWSPFAAAGLAPLAVFCGWTWSGVGSPVRTWRHRLGGFLTPSNLAAAALAAPVLCYYATRSAKFAVPPVADVVPGRSPTPLLEGHAERWLIVYAAFVAVEFGFLALALAGSFAGERGKPAVRERKLTAVSVFLLLLLPTVHYGYANDLVMRGSLPALWTLQVLLLRRFPAGDIQSPTGRRWPGVLCTVVFAFGLGNAGLEYRRHLGRMWLAGRWHDETRVERPGGPPASSLFELQRTLYRQPGFDFARQYLGSPDTFYGRWLAPAERSPPQPVAE